MKQAKCPLCSRRFWTATKTATKQETRLCMTCRRKAKRPPQLHRSMTHWWDGEKYREF